MTPLLRELAPIPIFGSASRTKTSPQRAERARAIAQPTTPPPMITMLACSTVYSLAGHLRIRSWSFLCSIAGNLSIQMLVFDPQLHKQRGK